MNKFFRAIGFAEDLTAVERQHLVEKVLANPVYRAYTTQGTESLLAEFRMEAAPRCGMSVVGEFDELDQFRCEYSYPYFLSDEVSTVQKVSIEPHIREESYAGICDDIKVGVSLIFHLVNFQDYLKKAVGGALPDPDRQYAVSLSALSIEGTIVLPIYKTSKEQESSKRKNRERTRKIKAAMEGDEQAVQSLTMEDMDIYAAISRQIQVKDVFSLVDSYFMPYSVECDMYSVLCEIETCETVQNTLTGEEMWKMRVSCNDLHFPLMIAKQDLYGEPAPGRRFKGNIWLQGQIHFDEA